MPDEPLPEGVPEGEPGAEAPPPEPADAPEETGPGVEALRDEGELPYTVQPTEPAAEEPGAPADEGHAGLLDAVAAVHETGTRIERRLGELQNLFDRERRAEAAREKVIDRLHAELQEYKQDLLLNTLRPVFIDLIQLHDDIGKMAVTPQPNGDGVEPDPVAAEARRWVAMLLGLQQGIEDILYRQGVEPFRVEGEAFDPRQQRAVSTVPADDPALNKTVAVRHRKGFRAGDRVIRPEVVSVYAVKK